MKGKKMKWMKKKIWMKWNFQNEFSKIVIVWHWIICILDTVKEEVKMPEYLCCNKLYNMKFPDGIESQLSWFFFAQKERENKTKTLSFSMRFYHRKWQIHAKKDEKCLTLWSWVIEAFFLCILHSSLTKKVSSR